jgi:hypothetical protein
LAIGAAAGSQYGDAQRFGGLGFHRVYSCRALLYRKK